MAVCLPFAMQLLVLFSPKLGDSQHAVCAGALAAHAPLPARARAPPLTAVDARRRAARLWGHGKVNVAAGCDHLGLGRRDGDDAVLDERAHAVAMCECMRTQCAAIQNPHEHTQ